MHEPGDTQADEAAVPVPHERMTENWLPVVGHEGYEVSDHGRVRGPRGRVLKPWRDKTRRGLLVSLHNRSLRIHTLVLEAFVGPRPEGMECCHYDDDDTNNHLDNLRWDTSHANTLDSIRNGNHPNAGRTHCVHGHEFTPDNTRVSMGKRYCRKCDQAASERRRQRISC